MIRKFRFFERLYMIGMVGSLVIWSIKQWIYWKIYFAIVQWVGDGDHCAVCLNSNGLDFAFK